MQQYIEFIANHPLLFGLLVLTLLMVVYTEYQRLLMAGASLTVTQATRLQSDGDAIFLDIRDNAAFKLGHLINAKNIPLKTLSTKTSELGKDKQKPVIIYCENGVRSSKACSLLRRAGFEKVYVISGGIAAWEKSTLPLVNH